MKAIVPVHVERKILVLRGERVMLDADLAELYEVETRSLIQAVKRKRGALPRGLHVPAHHGRGCDLEITNWDLKCGPRGAPLRTVCLHRARRGDALLRAA